MIKISFRIPIKHLLLLLGLVALASAGSSSLRAQNRGNPNWYVRAVPYLWFSNLGGAETLGADLGLNYVADFAIPVEDTVLEKSWAAQLELGKGRFRGIVNISEANQKNSAEIVS
ncbi:MAG: hypothetical protein GWP06_15805, partial [Actinobacteria bacterium]|nr:hypothetical protein [Actinomycetota bacterium]